VGTDWVQGRKKPAARNHQWEVIRLRALREYLGTVSAPDDKVALRAAVKLFAIPMEERKRRARNRIPLPVKIFGET
jgi:hypothetical protein